ncbi:MAG: cytidylate kinase-like family protein [Endomicrobia bacterium]|nr:cytidylate kinase-like family protein [Endomicrobiia bacterium]
MNEKYVINIGRQCGAGGLKIAEILSKKLGINYYDKNLIEIAAKKSGIGKEFFEKNEDNSPAGITGDLSGFFSNAVTGGYYGGSLLLNESLFKIQSDIIRQLARKESCIFVGRCADYILRDSSHCLNVFICGGIDERAERIMKERNEETDIEKVKKKIEKTDKNRAKYYTFYTNKTWGIAASYHLCINSSALGFDGTAAFIESFAKKKFGLE